ncbi:MAG: hypothetical protein C0433_04200 [Cyclobacterium sp.]|nr:hypothetical protein [Cyclobacterium sp.]
MLLHRHFSRTQRQNLRFFAKISAGICALICDHLREKFTIKSAKYIFHREKDVLILFEFSLV